MKKQLLLFVLTLVLAVSGSAQTKSVVGKWKIASLQTAEMNINLEDPQSIRKMMADQMEKGSGQKPDSAQLEMIVNMLTSTFRDLRMEFTAEGEANFTVPNPQGGEAKSEKGTYTADYAKGVMTTTMKEGATNKKENFNIRFEGDYLILGKTGDGPSETLRLKKVN